MPRNPLKKYSVVDLRCHDARGRQFVVEMQMMWTSAFKQRVLFNASKAYVSQLETGDEYELLQPVYSLNIVDDVYSDSPSYYHEYRIVAIEETDEVIDGLRFVFIELPKFDPMSYSDKKMQVLWLRYLTEINAKTREAPKDLMSEPVIRMGIQQDIEQGVRQEKLKIASSLRLKDLPMSYIAEITGLAPEEKPSLKATILRPSRFKRIL